MELPVPQTRPTSLAIFEKGRCEDRTIRVHYTEVLPGASDVLIKPY